MTDRRRRDPVDFAGTAPQVRGGINSPLAVHEVRGLRRDPARARPLDPELRRLLPRDHRRRPTRGRSSTRFPAACGARGITGFRVMDAVPGALAQAVPDRVPADGEGGNTIISLGGDDRAGRPFIYVDMFSGARGARRGRRRPVRRAAPGLEQREHADRDRGEHLSAPLPRYGMVEDSASARAVARLAGARPRVHYLGADTPVQVRSDKRDHPPFGLAGGAPGRPSMTTVDHAGDGDRAAGHRAVRRC